MGALIHQTYLRSFMNSDLSVAAAAQSWVRNPQKLRKMFKCQAEVGA